MTESHIPAESHLPRRLERRWRNATTAQRRRRQLKALLAGGLVLGIGASATFAAWTDQENATGTFEAGQFNIEANVDGQWQNSNGPYEMQFDSGPMFPGQDVYTAVSIRSTIDTTVDGDLSVEALGSTEGLGPHLNYRTVVLPDGTDPASCSEDSFTSEAAYVFGSATGPDVPLSSAPDPPVDATRTVAAGGNNVVSYCFHVQLPVDADDDAQGTTADHTWRWKAESVVPE